MGAFFSACVLKPRFECIGGDELLSVLCRRIVYIVEKILGKDDIVYIVYLFRC